jgi:hypothetical protein
VFLEPGLIEVVAHHKNNPITVYFPALDYSDPFFENILRERLFQMPAGIAPKLFIFFLH